MQNVEGSNPKHSFHYLGGSNRLYVFEAPIDLLSFISLYSHTNWQRHNYVALCGVSSHAMVERLSADKTIEHVVLCLDNDKSGLQVCERFKGLLDGLSVRYSVVLPDGKDFNLELVGRGEVGGEWVLG